MSIGVELGPGVGGRGGATGVAVSHCDFVKWSDSFFCVLYVFIASAVVLSFLRASSVLRNLTFLLTAALISSSGSSSSFSIHMLWMLEVKSRRACVLWSFSSVVTSVLKRETGAGTAALGMPFCLSMSSINSTMLSIGSTRPCF